MAMSPEERELLLLLCDDASAGRRLTRMPAPMVAAPATALPFKNERRLTLRRGDELFSVEDWLVSEDTIAEPSSSLLMVPRSKFSKIEFRGCRQGSSHGERRIKWRSPRPCHAPVREL